ncbi:hypothetical protein J2T17_007654 [Paenibacillus mucilaginosus]|uniref:hypothetical protein n=1 Tax=Paenibacillus mucilaginosus TaxID=61624 RepID=UPI003D20E260
MLLKEFDLDLPYLVDTEINSGDATKKDYEENWKEKRISFRRETRCISALYERFLQKYKTVDTWKVLIECVKEVSDPRVRTALGVTTTQVPFDYDFYIKCGESEKKKYILELLRVGIEKIIKDKNWDPSLFLEAYTKIIDVNYLNEWIFKKPVKSPTKEYLAYVYCEHKITAFVISIIICDKDKNILLQKTVIEEIPDEFFFNEHLGKLVWSSPHKVSLINKEGTQSWSITI